MLSFDLYALDNDDLKTIFCFYLNDWDDNDISYHCDTWMVIIEY